MYYFNNEYLRQYLHANAGPVKVYVDNDYYTISDDSDLAKTDVGVAYDAMGKPKVFNYQQVQAVRVGNMEFTFDQLQASMGAEDKGDGESSEEEPETTSDTAPEEDDIAADEKPEKEPQKSNYYYNKLLIKNEIRNGRV